MRVLKILNVSLMAIASTAGCAITSERPVFGPQATVKMEAFQGEYRLYDPWDRKFNEDLFASVSDGALELVSAGECEEEECGGKPVVVRLSASENSYAVQVPIDEGDAQVLFVFVAAIDDYGAACVEIDEDRHPRHIERIRDIAAASDLEVGSRRFNPVFITGNPEPERVMRFLDEVWAKVPMEAWSCYGLIPAGKSVDGIEEIMTRTAWGAARKN